MAHFLVVQTASAAKHRAQSGEKPKESVRQLEMQGRLPTQVTVHLPMSKNASFLCFSRLDRSAELLHALPEDSRDWAEERESRVRRTRIKQDKERMEMTMIQASGVDRSSFGVRNQCWRYFRGFLLWVK